MPKLTSKSKSLKALFRTQQLKADPGVEKATPNQLTNRKSNRGQAELQTWENSRSLLMELELEERASKPLELDWKQRRRREKEGAAMEAVVSAPAAGAEAEAVGMQVDIVG